MTTHAPGGTSVLRRVQDFSRLLPAMTNDELFQAFRLIQATKPWLTGDTEQFEELYWKGVNAEVKSRLLAGFPTNACSLTRNG